MNAADIENYHTLTFKERERFLRFICKLGEKGLKRLFRFPGENFSMWWFSLVAEKSVLKSNSYEKLTHRLFYRSSAYFKMNSRNRICETPLVQFVKGLFLAGSFFFKIIYIKTAMDNFKKRRKKLSSDEYCIVSYYPLINKEAEKEGIFENGYFGAFHSGLERRHSSEYSHILLQVQIDRYTLKDAVNMARRFLKKQSVFFLEEFFKPWHLFAFVLYYCYFSLLFVLNVRRIKKQSTYEYNGEELNVWHVFKGDFYRSFCGYNLAASIWYILLFREMTRAVKADAKILCVWEMQAWEKALYVYAKKRGQTTIGVQHTIVPEMMLNYFNDPGETESENFFERCPSPDYLGVIGDIPHELLGRHGGRPAEKLFVWGAQRFESLRNVEAISVPWSERGDYFVCAFTLDPIDSRRIILMLKDAFQANSGYRILLKGHPATDMKKVHGRDISGLDPAVFEHTDVPIPEIVRHAKGMIVTASSSCFFALACGIPVIVLRFPDKVDCNPLSYVSDLPLYAYSAEQLRTICDNTVAAPESPVSRHECREILKKYMYFPEDDNEYIDKIDRLV